MVVVVHPWPPRGQVEEEAASSAPAALAAPVVVVVVAAEEEVAGTPSQPVSRRVVTLLGTR